MLPPYSLEVKGNAFYEDDYLKYKFSVTWEDKTDPNSQYFGDVWRAKILKLFYKPSDFYITITWDDNFLIEKNEKKA